MQMKKDKDMRKHLYDFNKVMLDQMNIRITIEEEDQGIILLSSLSKSYEHFVDINPKLKGNPSPCQK